ncbi:unnamed protein product [Mytilus coruscus]|uniref:Ubiquitin carboxyl-terminal hydrolase 36 n=1 Tax=Mytilus coruscus TaxID=42192 RepID=A0A6J8C1A6_MYTCO|nr:unnamed protein product [Mytilus coruscus]
MVKIYRKKYLNRNLIQEQEVRTAIKELKVTTFTKSWREKDSEYGHICKFLGRKNNDINRSRIRSIIDYGIEKKKGKGKRNHQMTESDLPKKEEGNEEHNPATDYNNKTLPTGLSKVDTATEQIKRGKNGEGKTLSLPDDEDEILINDQSPVSLQKEVDIPSSSEAEPMYQLIDDEADLGESSKIKKNEINIVPKYTKDIFERKEGIQIVESNVSKKCEEERKHITDDEILNITTITNSTEKLNREDVMEEHLYTTDPKKNTVPEELLTITSKVPMIKRTETNDKKIMKFPDKDDWNQKNDQSPVPFVNEEDTCDSSDEERRYQFIDGGTDLDVPSTFILKNTNISPRPTKDSLESREDVLIRESDISNHREQEMKDMSDNEILNQTVSTHDTENLISEKVDNANSVLHLQTISLGACFSGSESSINIKTADKTTESYLSEMNSEVNVANQNFNDVGIRHSAAEKCKTEAIPLPGETSDNVSMDEHESSDSSGLENPFCTVSSCIDSKRNEVKMDSNICSEEVILIDTDKENTDSCPKLSQNTLEAMFGSAVIGKYFESRVPSKGSFSISPSQWSSLCSNRRGRYLARGSWEHIIASGIKSINPYCLYMFKYHKVSIASRTPKNTALFRGEGECKFRDCKNICKFSMNCDNVVNVEVGSNVKHNLKENHARPIQGHQRQETKNVFQDGKKPMKHYLQQFKDTPQDVKIAGNFSNFGNTIRTFQQIAHESRNQNRLIRTNLKSENGVRIWHDLAKSGIVHWDATGSIVSHRDDQWKYYYYELACSNPVPGQPVIPVSSMISSLHSTPLVRFWLSEFRRSEKKIYGHANISIPHQVNSDRSLVFIQAALSDFNNEDLNEYRSRSFRIINGCAKDGDLNGIFPHACLSHVMGSFKKVALDHYKSNFEFGMYCFSVLSSSLLTEVMERMHAIYYILLSKVVDQKTTEYLDILQKNISSLGLEDMDLMEMCTDSEYTTDLEALQLFTENQNPDFLTEEDFQSRSTRNEFAYLADSILTEVKAEIDQQFFIEVPGNKRYSPVLAEKIHKLYMPTLPLWSNLLLGDLSRHGTSEVYLSFHPPKECVRGNAKIEKRFQILKDIQLHGSTTKRLDEISVKIKDHITTVQELAALKSVKQGGKQKSRTGRSTKTVEESWDKRKPSTKQNQLIGKFQKAPTQKQINMLIEGSKVTPKKLLCIVKTDTHIIEIDEEYKTDCSTELLYTDDKKTRMFTEDALFVNTTKNLINNKYLCEIYTDKSRDNEDPNYLQSVKDSSTSLANHSNNCWFNSIVQLFSQTKLMRNVNEQFNAHLSYEEEIRSVLMVFDKVGKGEEVTWNLIHSALNELNTIYGLEIDRQNDAHEFVMNVVRHFMELNGVDMYITIAEAYIYTNCGSKVGIDQQIYSDLQLAIAEDVKQHEGVKDLLDRYFEDERIEATCCNGVKRWRHIRLINVPSDLSICLVRHTSMNNITRKNRKPISIDRILNMGKYMSTQMDLLYRLTGVVIHHGTSPRNGHYTYVKTDGGPEIQINDCSFKVYDDANLLKDSYLLQYEQIPDDEAICHNYLPDVIISIIECEGWKKLENTIQFSVGLSVRKDMLFQLMQQITITEEIQIHSWKAYKLLQEVIGSVVDTSIADITKTVLTYFSNNCPAALYENFGITSIRSYHCCNCDNKGTDCEQHLLHDCQMFNNPVNSSVTSRKLSTCNMCGEQSLTEGEYVINRARTMIVKDCLDILKLEQLESLMSIYNPRAIVSNSGTVLFKYASEAVHILLVERHGTVCQINVGQVYEAIRNTNECVMFLEKKNTKQSGYEAEASKFALVKEQYICKNDNDPLSLFLCEEEKNLIKNFKAPVCVGSLHLSKEEVNRFLLDDFSDLNIDAYLETLKSKSENNMFLPAVWYNATFSSTFVRKPDTSKAWLNNDLIFVPANVDSNHWVLIVIKPKERYIYYLDPLGKDPNHDVLDLLCKFLNNQILLEHYESHLTVWKVENLMNNGIFPSQTDSTSCGPLICLYVKMILEDRRLMEYHVSPVQIRQYIFKEVIKVYKNDLNTDLSFGLKNIIFTEDLDAVVYNIVMGKHVCNDLHNNFLKNPCTMKRQDLIGFADEYLSPDVYYLIQTYLTDTYFMHVTRPLKLPYQQSIFSDAKQLNTKLQQNVMYANWYVECVLGKEVIAEILGRFQNITTVEMRQICSKTEYSCREAIKEEIQSFRQARKNLKMN